jgi:hypothetical protein
MSQQQAEQMEMEQLGSSQQGGEVEQLSHEDEFSQGMDAALGGSDGNESQPDTRLNAQLDQGSQPDPTPAAEQQEPPAQPATHQVAPPQPAMPDQLPHTPPQQPARPQEPESAPKIEAPEEMADELESLKTLTPQAAELALEDSPEGASIRARLEQFGAELAQDRAEQILQRRALDRADEDRAERARQAHNANFRTILENEHPNYVAMLDDPARRSDAALYQQSIFDWIAAKPYAEAVNLMEIARNGRDPRQVSALISQFERERAGGQAKRPDPTGALAVPGRGAPVAPSGVGGLDDFDAGFDAGLSSE